MTDLRLFAELQEQRIRQSLLRYQAKLLPVIPDSKFHLTGPKASHKHPRRYRCACGRLRRKADQRCPVCQRLGRSLRPHVDAVPQRTWEREQIAHGNCRNCGAPRERYAIECDACAEKRRARQRQPGGQPWQPGMRGRPTKALEATHADAL